uniref:Glycosyltransferase 2-like domain-containing protein n=1 Tax=Oryzias sinensis TaxID=183150 RepID=A0A8C7WRK4_9TELE
MSEQALHNIHDINKSTFGRSSRITELLHKCLSVAVVCLQRDLFPRPGDFTLLRIFGVSTMVVCVVSPQGVNRMGRDSLVGLGGPRRKDWHDYEAIRRDATRSGNGEQGKAFPLTDADRVDQAYRENGFNIFVSDRISLNRSVPDIRHPNCKQKLYAERLPNTSIIIPFHNEGWSSLLRTVHSVLNRSPPQLIAEIILVDDFSDKDHLKGALEEYMVRLPKVRILRTKKREGLIRTRLLGAAAAKGEVITFLDSHCEANINWLPPLLDRIALNRKTIVCPMIDVIDHDNFGYETQAGDAMRGAFDWEMYYKRIPIPAELQKNDPSEPFESPVMAGGLFAVDRKWFWELGGYDTGLEIWGGEQYEISFKVWMCGGRMEDIPCSRVGHIYRKYVPYKVPGGVSLARVSVASSLSLQKSRSKPPACTGVSAAHNIAALNGSESSGVTVDQELAEAGAPSFDTEAEELRCADSLCMTAESNLLAPDVARPCDL